MFYLRKKKREKIILHIRFSEILISFFESKAYQILFENYNLLFKITCLTGLTVHFFYNMKCRNQLTVKLIKLFYDYTKTFLTS